MSTAGMRRRCPYHHRHHHGRGPVSSPSLSDLHETTGTYEISVVKQGETGPLRL